MTHTQQHLTSIEHDLLSPLDAEPHLVATRRTVRSKLLQRCGDRYAVTAVVHLLGAEAERSLRHRIDVLESRRAVLRHCRPTLHDSVAAQLAACDEQLPPLTRELDAGILLLATVIAPLRLDRLSLDRIGAASVRQAQRAIMDLQAALVRVVDDVVDADLLETEPCCWGPSAVPELRCIAADADADADADAAAGADADAVGRIRAFAAEVAHLGAERGSCEQRLRHAARWACVETTPTRTARRLARREEARAELDVLGARQAARAEVESIGPR